MSFVMLRPLQPLKQVVSYSATSTPEAKTFHVMINQGDVYVYSSLCRSPLRFTTIVISF